LLGIFNIFNGEFNRKEVLENNLKFIPHITLFRINNSQIYEKHRENIEEIVNEKLEKLKNKDISTKRIYLYKVNSKFP
jgi:2'-5' RNA ligase